MSHENRKAVVQLVRDLAAKGLDVHFQLQMLSGYNDKKFRKRALITIALPNSVAWSFVSKNYKTSENASCDVCEQPYVAVKANHGLFEEREAKSLLNDIAGTLKSVDKVINGQAFAQQSLKLLFATLNDVFVSKETLLLKALASGITDEEAENFNGKEDIRCH